MARMYDLAILNATLVDGESGEPWTGDLAVRGDRIAFVGDLRGPARRVVDAYGKVLAPGFIDLHGHSDYSLLGDPLARSKVHQGVTTEVGGNCGYHAAPVFGAIAAARREEYGRSMGLDVGWSTSAEYRACLSAARPSINYAQQIGYNTLRSAVTADHGAALSASEREALRRLVRDEMAQGAVGLSYGLAYTPACFSRTEELIDAAEETERAGGFISFHIRNEDHALLESLEEAIAIGRAAGAPTHIGHLKTFRRMNWHKIGPALAMLEEARASGLDLTVDRYPHLAMNTQLKFVLPTWALEGGASATAARLRDPEARARITRELRDTVHGEVKEVLLSLVASPSNKRYEGLFLDQAAAGKDPFDLVCDLLLEEGEAAFATFFGMSRANLDRILALDYAVIASDSSIQPIDRQAGGGRPHPRCFDTFAYFLAEWVFARRLIPLPEAIRRITSLPARRAGLVDRGRLVEGSFADLVLFDPALLRAEASYEDPIHYPAGIELVVVNGAVVVDHGVHTGARPGVLLTRRAG
jgi:N-acyl-D-aspartate/D-glutamate deacylase